MDLFNQLIKQVIDFAVEAEANYNVNPWVFTILFFGSAIPLYYGYYRIGRSALKIEDKKIKRKELDKKELKIGLTISVIAWWMPYVYVIVFGRLPLHLWLVFIGFVAVMGVFFVQTLRTKVNKAEETNEEKV